VSSWKPLAVPASGKPRRSREAHRKRAHVGRGRKSGAAYGRHGQRPVSSVIDDTYDVPTPLTCPDCGAAVDDTHVTVQYQEELPPVRPLVRRFDVHVGRCRECGRRVQGRHPLQTSDAVGAAAVQPGPQAVATAASLNKQLGLSFGKIVTLFADRFGFPLSDGLCDISTANGPRSSAFSTTPPLTPPTGAPNRRSGAPWSAGRTNTDRARPAEPRLRPFSTRSARPRGSPASIPRRTSCAPVYAASVVAFVDLFGHSTMSFGPVGGTGTPSRTLRIRSQWFRKRRSLTEACPAGIVQLPLQVIDLLAQALVLTLQPIALTLGPFGTLAELACLAPLRVIRLRTSRFGHVIVMPESPRPYKPKLTRHRDSGPAPSGPNALNEYLIC
jgi:hypothetical protein